MCETLDFLCHVRPELFEVLMSIRRWWRNSWRGWGWGMCHSLVSLSLTYSSSTHMDFVYINWVPSVVIWLGFPPSDRIDSNWTNGDASLPPISSRLLPYRPIRQTPLSYSTITVTWHLDPHYSKQSFGQKSVTTTTRRRWWWSRRMMSVRPRRMEYLN